jgi:hypothetical protein
MIPENLLFWIAPIADAPSDDPPVLCLRHADLMVLPRGWTLDDRRERFPRLFASRPAPKPRGAVAPAALQTAQEATQTAHPHHARRARRQRHAQPEQLVIDGTGEIPRPSIGEPVAAQVTPSPAVDPVLVPVIEPEPEVCFDLDAVAAHEPEPPGEPVPAWTPDFNTDDTLNGLLKAKSPLLARAFRGTGRRR